MSPAHVIEPTYLGIKRRLRTGAWPMGMRLEGAKLADELGVSVTPVRDCLNRLVGERLVEFRPGEGYRVARLSERLFRDLLLFNCDLLGRVAQSQAAALIIDTCEGAPYPERIASLFGQVATCSGSAVVIEAVEGLTDRLYAARCFDQDLVAQCAIEMKVFVELFKGDAVPAERIDWLNAYHRRRCEMASEYVSRLEQGPEPR
jgi:hypothetical protein